MRPTALLSGLLGLIAGAATIEYPATVEVDIVFPLNKTYNNATQLPNNVSQFPVVFAVQHAEAAFAWGYSIAWKIFEVINGTASESSRAQGAVYGRGDIPPHDTLDDIWYNAGLTYNFTKLRPGEHLLSWEWTMITCQDIGKTRLYKSSTPASGEMYFSIVDDGSGEDVDLTGECPVYAGKITAKDGTEASNCPYMGKNEDYEPKPCRAKMDSLTAECVLANVTESDDRSACNELAGKAAAGGSRDNGRGEDAAGRAVLTSFGVIVPAFAGFMML